MNVNGVETSECRSISFSASVRAGALGGASVCTLDWTNLIGLVKMSVKLGSTADRAWLWHMDDLKCEMTAQLKLSTSGVARPIQ